MADISQIKTPDDTVYDIDAKKVNGHTVDTDVPSGAVFTDANVTQTATTTASVYEMIFSGSANNTTETAGVRKTDSLVYNPNNYNFASRCMAADVSKANNGVSANTWFPMMSVFDKSNRITTRIEDAFYTNGDIKASFLVRQYDTNGDQVANKGISMTMDKSGNLTYGVSDASAFLSAIGLTTTTPTYTITRSSGSWTAGTVTAKRFGTITFISITINFTAQVDNGSIGFQGTLGGNNILLPAIPCDTLIVEMNGTTPLPVHGYLSEQGVLTVRPITRSFNKSTGSAKFKFTFIT